jgi:hypothetical protein
MQKYLDSKGLTFPTEFLKGTDLDCFGPIFTCAGYKKGYKGIQEPPHTPNIPALEQPHARS